MAKPTYSGWSFIDKLVDPDAVNRGAKGALPGNLLNFISSESTLVAAGPATLGGASGGTLQNVVPIGVIQSFNISQNKNIAQLFEIGSKETILLPGRTFIQSSISRLLLDGPSLMKALYYNYSDTDNTDVDPPVSITGYSETVDGVSATTAGNGNFYINLASSLFSVPFGMALLLHDVNDEVYAGCYLENCSIASHSISFSAGQTVVAENCSIRVSKIKPVAFTA
jgi:hypothetical protein